MRIGQALDRPEKKKLSITEAASAIRINKKYIQALEDENFLLLPSEVYAKGFVKSYSNYLGIRPERTDCRAEYPFYKSIEDSKKTALSIENKSNVNYGGYINSIILGVVAVVVIGIIFYGAGI